ncbi:MAG TPA: PQQ-binding-like beta-propeller repeat protein [Vicinamibacteria bacterium]|nr:PQQ-binding-like beta-propeller repeat protein [Vicinamibacteria bacterium]
MTARLLSCGVVVVLLSAASAGAADRDRFWPQWRGPLHTGVAPQGNPPVEWSETKNVKWKVEIPGQGSGTPVVWGDAIYVLTAVPTGAAGGAQQFTILAIGRRDGKTLWRKVLREEVPHEGHHATNTFASASALTDGEHVYAFFGSRGLYALDLKGNLKWEKDLGDMNIKLGFGEAASPALHGDRLVVNWDHEGESFIVALDKRTGQERWRVPREEKTSWSTPLVVEHAGRAQVITSATHRVRSYDLATGDLVWQASGMTANAIPTPVHADGIVYLTSGFRGNALMAVKLAEARGDITNTPAVIWRHDRDTPYVPSPLLYGEALYVLKSNSGVLSAFEAKTGRKLYGEQRIEGVPNVYASLVGAGGRVYIAGRDGGVAVVEQGPAFKLLALNRLDDGFDASPVPVADELYLRGRKYLYRISAN